MKGWLVLLSAALSLTLDADGLANGPPEASLSRKVMRSEEYGRSSEAARTELRQAGANIGRELPAQSTAYVQMPAATQGPSFLCDKIPCTVTAAERARIQECSFLAENGQRAGCDVESPEHELVRRHISPNATVLELGARYGTTTCEIASVQGNSGKLVAAEPDSVVWDIWKKNIEAHGCNALQLKQVIGSVDRKVTEGKYGYDTRISLTQIGLPDDPPDVIRDVAHGKAVPFAEVEKRFHVKFDTLLVDCEGCLEYFLNDNPGMLEGIHTILLEADMGIYQGTKAPDCGTSCVNYDLVITRLEEQGFTIAESFREHFRRGDGRDDRGDKCPWIHHFALKRNRQSRY